MTLDGFITFLGLVAAALAIVSPVTRLQLRMAVGRLLVWSALFTGAVLYFEFFELLAIGCPGFLGSACPSLSRDGPLTPQQAAFLVVFVWLVILANALLRPRTTLRSLPTLERLVRRLAESGRYADLVDVVENSVGFIDDCATGQLPYQLRRARLAGVARPRPFFEPAGADVASSQANPIAEFWAALQRDYVALLPSDAGPREAAEGVLQILLRSGPVVDWVSEHRPRFGTRLLTLRSYKVGDFSERFLGWLISHQSSALYDEVQDNQNLARCGYVLTEHNAILRTLLADATVAERLEAYRPIGDHALVVLSAANAPAYVATLNLPFDAHWDEGGRWRDPTFVAIRFFDIMVQAAACQGVRWHMWLYYMKDVVERLEALYDDQVREEVFGEFPTRAARLIYAAFDALSDWVRIAIEVDEESPHRAPANDRVDHENDNIPKSAALALGICMRTVVLSDNIGDRVKRTLFNVALSPLREARMRAGHERLRKVLVDSIVQGGIVGGGPVYLERLQMLYDRIDRPWHDDLDDFRAALDGNGGDGL
ncbi:MAG: hypothetical protein V4574_09040 [Pseudomonadota bacterium]